MKKQLLGNHFLLLKTKTNLPEPPSNARRNNIYVCRCWSHHHHHAVVVQIVVVVVVVIVVVIVVVVVAAAVVGCTRSNCKYKRRCLVRSLLFCLHTPT